MQTLNPTSVAAALAAGSCPIAAPLSTVATSVAAAEAAAFTLACSGVAATSGAGLLDPPVVAPKESRHTSMPTLPWDVVGNTRRRAMRGGAA
jgi:hypothetical protein